MQTVISDIDVADWTPELLKAVIIKEMTDPHVIASISALHPVDVVIQYALIANRYRMCWKSNGNVDIIKC